MASEQAAAPDYAALATQAVEALSGTPRKQWGKKRAEYNMAVNRILHMWAVTRGVSRDALAPPARRVHRATGRNVGRPKANRRALCHPDRAHHGRGLCHSCYETERQRKARAAA